MTHVPQINWPNKAYRPTTITTHDYLFKADEKKKVDTFIDNMVAKRKGKK